MSKQEGCMSKLTFNKILVYSFDTEKYFFTEFGNNINIIYGRNTSGKSTLIQSVLFAMGINDSKDNMSEILNENVIFRLDCKVEMNGSETDLVFVRSDDTLVVRNAAASPVRFDGINSNNSYEYERYKVLFGELFDFDLKVQKQAELVKAPLETAFLPFYISQSVGWVYIRESIGDYRFYKDFKFDYLDYYTGLISGKDRLKKYDLQNEKKDIQFELKQLNNYKAKNKDLRIAEAVNERFKSKSLEYLENYSMLNNELSTEEASHSKLCNNLSMLRGRHKVLSQVIKNIKNQKPKIDQCPTCDQKLPGDLKEYYTYNQDINDAIKEKQNVADKIKNISSKLNSVGNKIISIRIKVKEEYGVFRQFSTEGTKFESWVDHQANLKLLDNVSLQKNQCEERITKINEKIKMLGVDADIEKQRSDKERFFLGIFTKKAKALNVRIPINKRYRDLYSISSFPFQGVELHKIVMAYHFSFNELVWNNSSVHKFPFLLDAIFKEDIDTKNRDEIFKFISSESRANSQIIFTVAEYKSTEDATSPNNLFSVSDVNKKYFMNKAKQICIGDAVSERALLSQSDFSDKELLDDTLALLETV